MAGLRLTNFARGKLRLSVFVCIMLLLIAVELAGGLDAPDHYAFDLMSTVSPPSPSRRDIVIVAIDEPSFSALGKPWPWPRQIHADLIRALRKAGARYIGFDVVFADPSSAWSDGALASATDPSVILGADETVSDTPQGSMLIRTEPMPRFTKRGARVGVTSVVVDADGVVRHIPRYSDSFALRFAGSSTQLSQRQRLIQYFGGARTYPYVSYYQALNPAQYLPEDFFKGRDVIIGLVVHASPEARGADLFETSFTARNSELVPGVEIQATMIDNLRHRLWISPAPSWIALMMLILGCAFGYGVATPESLSRRWVLFAIATFGTLTVLWLTMRVGRLWVSPVQPLLGLGAVFGALSVTDVTLERRRRRQVQTAFGQYLAPALVERLIANPDLAKLNGERKCMTFLFADVRGFTTISETMKDEPEAITRLINQILSPLSDIILRHQGTIDKYIGDCVMAFWNAPIDDPDHAKHAVAAAAEMIAALPAINASLSSDAPGTPGVPHIAIGVGVNTGDCIVGNMGTAKRFDYTVVGDPVNVAARLESLSKDYGVPIVVGENTVALTADRYEFMELDTVAVRGTSRKQKIYAFVRARGDDAENE